MNILVVDDREENLYLMQHELAAAGHGVSGAADGAKALEQLRQGGFDMVISDILMPVMDGFELCRRIRADGHLSRLGFVIYTATYTGPQDESFALGIGADRFVQKPCDTGQLLDILDGVLAGRRDSGPPPPRAAQPEGAVLRLYNERLIRNLEAKNQQLEEEARARRSAEESLRQSEQKLRQLFASIRDAIVVADLEGGIIQVNQAFCTQFRVGSAAALGQRMARLSADPQCPWNQPVTESATGANAQRIVSLLRWDGSSFPGEVQSYFLRNDEGEVIGLVAVVHDVSDRLRRAEELRRAREFLDAVINAMPVALFCKDSEEHRFRLWNRAAEEMFGMSAEQALGRNDYDFFPKDQADFFWDKDNESIALGRIVDIPEEPITRSDGTLRYLHTRKVPVKGPDGQPGWLLAVSEDITERRAASHQLRLAHAEAEELLSVLSAMLIGIDGQGRVVRYNAAAERLLGLKAAEVKGRTLQDSGIALDWTAVMPLITTTLADGATRGLHDVRCTHAGGEVLFLDITVNRAQPVGPGGSHSVILVGYDTTKRRQLEVQRTQGQKLEAVGQLAAGIAHEVNTPIQFVGDNLNFLGNAFRDLGSVVAAVQTRLQQGAVIDGELARVAEHVDLAYLLEQVPQAIGQALEGVSRVTEIVRALKEFSHPDTGTKEPVDINRCLLTTLTVARNEYKYAAEVATSLTPDLPCVPGMAGQLGQVFVNLVVNAAHAIREKRQSSGGRGLISISTGVVGGMVEIRIRDDGVGIRPAHRKHLFTPFFTTKPVGQGTGQGLALCHAVVVGNHGGSIACESEYGHGCTFIIRLPVAEASGQHRAQPPG